MAIQPEKVTGKARDSEIGNDFERAVSEQSNEDRPYPQCERERGARTRLFEVHLSGRMGSPYVAGSSSRPRSASNVESAVSFALRPPPGLRIRPASTCRGSAISFYFFHPGTVIGELSEVRIGGPRRHLACERVGLDGLGPRPGPLIIQQRHGTDLAGPVSLLAVALKDRQDVLLECRGGAGWLLLCRRDRTKYSPERQPPHGYNDTGSCTGWPRKVSGSNVSPQNSLEL